MTLNNLICIAGPTASGKTALSLALAKELDGEIVSCDSMQVYRRMDIGTAKPTVEERAGIVHYMLDVAEPEEDFSVSRYCAMADPIVQDILARGKTAIIVGGTGLYMDSLIKGNDFAPFPATGVREALEARPIEEVYGELKGMGGSTVVACLLYDEKLYYAGAGDSFLYLLRQGRLIRLNRAHTLKNQRYLELINADCMDPTSARTMAEAHAVTQFLGVDVLDDVDWFRRAMPLEDGDTLLLCSDGIAGVLSESQLAEYLNLENINDSCARMQQAILEKNLVHQDNFTGIVIRCKK